MVFKSPPDDPEQYCQIATGIESMIEPPDATNVSLRIECGDGFCGVRTKI
jgi:hypothetical protein